MATSSNRTVMVTGATGLLGRAVMKEIAARPMLFEALGVGFSRAKAPIRKLDITDATAVIKFFEEHKPSAVIHCAAEKRPDVAETNQEATQKLNVDSTRLLAELCKKYDAFFAYVSTDYVFDGKKPVSSTYEIDDVPNPLNAYGKTKLLGEKAVQEVFAKSNSSKGYIILRIPVLYGEADEPSESAINTLLNCVKEANKPGAPKLKVDGYQGRYPTYVGDVARVLGDLCQLALVGDGQGAPWNMQTIYHFSSQKKYTKFEICELFASILGLSTNNIEKGSSEGTANRPDHIKLSNKMAFSHGISTMTQPLEDWWKCYLTKATAK